MGLLSWLKSGAVKVGAAFVKAFGKDAAQKFAEGAVAILKTAAGVLAIDAVRYAMNLQLGSSTETRDAAAAKLTTDAKSLGIKISNSMINMLIEVAVQALVKQNILVG